MMYIKVKHSKRKQKIKIYWTWKMKYSKINKYLKDLVYVKDAKYYGTF